MDSWIVVLETNTTQVDIIQVNKGLLEDMFFCNVEWYLGHIGYNVNEIQWQAYDVPPTIRIK